METGVDGQDAEQGVDEDRRAKEQPEKQEGRDSGPFKMAEQLTPVDPDQGDDEGPDDAGDQERV